MFQIDEVSFVCINDRMKRSLLPLGEKVADRRKGALVKRRVLKTPPHPSPLPQFFASVLPSNTTFFLRKKSGERGQRGALQFGQPITEMRLA